MIFKIINTIKLILNSKWIFDQPIKKIVIYDFLHSSYLSKYLKKTPCSYWMQKRRVIFLAFD